MSSIEDKIQAAVLCPISRDDFDGSLKVLLTRRNYMGFTSKKTGKLLKKPQYLMRFPGEFVFPGGKRVEGEDPYTLSTGLREFKEELGYEGDFKLAREIDVPGAQMDDYSMTLYLVQCNDENPSFDYDKERGEIIAHKWMKPTMALSYLTCERFTAEIDRKLSRLGYDQARREPSLSTIESLKRIIDSEEIILELLH